jgi:hypothetical protein
MHTNTQPRVIRQLEKGNAVALTLLGLSVALLAGMVVLFLIGKERPQPIPLDIANLDMNDTEDGDSVDPYTSWETYTNAQFEFSIRYPKGWIVAEGLEEEFPMITLYDASQPASTSTTEGVHEYPTSISVYPKGNPSYRIIGVDIPSNTLVPIRGASATDYILEGTKSPWATAVKFDTHPTSWGPDGHIFVRAHIEDEVRTFLRDSEEIDEATFDPQNGDTMQHVGFVNPETWNTLSLILQSFTFSLADISDTNSMSNSGTTTNSARIDITLRNPQPDELLTSPLLVEGTVDETWGTSTPLLVSLADTEGTILATSSAPLGLDDGASSSRFTTVLSFEAVSDSVGVLSIQHPEGTTDPLSLTVRFTGE